MEEDERMAGAPCCHLHPRCFCQAFTITDDHGNDTRSGRKMLQDTVKMLKKLFGDKAYHTEGIYNILSRNGVEAVIPLMKSASTSSRDSPIQRRS